MELKNLPNQSHSSKLTLLPLHQLGPKNNFRCRIYYKSKILSGLEAYLLMCFSQKMDGNSTYEYVPYFSNLCSVTSDLCSGTSIQVPLFRYLESGTLIQVPLFRYLNLDTSVQVPQFRYLCLGTSIQVPLFRYLSSGTSVQVPQFRYLSLGT